MGAKDWYQRVEEYLEGYYDDLVEQRPYLDFPDDTFHESPYLLRVETENAHYAHFMSYPFTEEEVSDSVLEDTDAIIMESRNTPHEEYELEDKLEEDQYLSTDAFTDALASPRELPGYLENVMDEVEDREHRTIIRQNLEGDQVPMYLVDLPSQATLADRLTNTRMPKWVRKQGLRHAIPKKTMMRSLLRVNPAVLAADLAFSAAGYVPKKLGVGKTPTSYMQLIKAPTSSGLQSAVAAEKAESHIAPQLEDELGRKPNILLVYDVKDQDIVPYLRHPWIREQVIDKQARMDYCLADTSYLDKVYEFRFDGDGEETLAYGDDSITYTKTAADVDTIEERDCLGLVPWPSKIYDGIRSAASGIVEYGKTHREYREAIEELEAEYPPGARLRKLQRQHDLDAEEEQERQELLQESIELAQKKRELKEQYFGDGTEDELDPAAPVPEADTAPDPAAEEYVAEVQYED